MAGRRATTRRSWRVLSGCGLKGIIGCSHQNADGRQSLLMPPAVLIMRSTSPLCYNCVCIGAWPDAPLLPGLLMRWRDIHPTVGPGNPPSIERADSPGVPRPVKAYPVSPKTPATPARCRFPGQHSGTVPGGKTSLTSSKRWPERTGLLCSAACPGRRNRGQTGPGAPSSISC